MQLLVNTIKALSDADLQTLVSHLSSDFLRNADTEQETVTGSTMEAMEYAFNTSARAIESRDGSLRDQAQNY